MKITPRVTGNITRMSIGYKYRSEKVLGFIAKEGVIINNPVVPCLSCYPDNFYNVYTFPFLHP